jgi:ribosome-associated translation inhibitor RaiA
LDILFQIEMIKVVATGMRGRPFGFDFYIFRGRRGFSTRISSSIGEPLSLPRLLERLFMQIPLQISFENAEPSEAVRAAIGHEVERLEKYQHHITGCRVAVVAPSTKHRHGAVYRINIWVTIPPHENIVVSHQPSDDRGHVHVEVAIKHAFAAARRQIEALAQRASGKVKLHFRKPQNR